MRPDAPRRRATAAYLLLFGAQTLCATTLFFLIFPIFQRMVTRIGEPNPPDARTMALIAGAAVVMQACYWTRYTRVPLWVPRRSPVVGHVLMFAGRASFFFGGALFSAIAFRHVPQLEVLPPIGQGIAKALGVAAVLFALFCYSLELDRLGRAIEDGSA